MLSEGNVDRMISMATRPSYCTTADDMTVQVTIGVSQPDKVDTAAVLASLPHGNGQGTCVAGGGGLEIPSVDGNDGMLIANAVIIVNFDDDK